MASGALVLLGLFLLAVVFSSSPYYPLIMHTFEGLSRGSDDSVLNYDPAMKMTSAWSEYGSSFPIRFAGNPVG